jgi:1-aminocyclopropane-1-carboxylate deaminase/D-cysteine desulfhydrase-like pyridoxal-dependent ACC family enzyme
LRPDALAKGADTLITAGGLQSNHARATAATAARLGLRCVIVANAVDPLGPRGGGRLTGNALLNALLGARVEYVASRDERGPRMDALAADLRREGRTPYVIPIGASIPLGALGIARAVVELSGQIAPPDAIVHSTSSAGTQAGLVAGCRLLGWPTRVIGVSADDPADSVRRDVAQLIAGLGDLLEAPDAVRTGTAVEVDDTFVGDGYGIPTPESRDAMELAARSEALFLDPTYTAKAMAGLIAYVRAKRFAANQTVLFWHTGGQVGLFA